MERSYLVILLASQPGDTSSRYACYPTDANGNIQFPGVWSNGKRDSIVSPANIMPEKLSKNSAHNDDLDFIIREFFPENDPEEIKNILLKNPASNPKISNERLMEGDTC